MSGKGAGFTIVEVMIFLGISALLILVALVGTGTTARYSRFSSSINTTHSFLQRQYEEIRNGVNVRGSAITSDCIDDVVGLSSGDCLLLGRTITFDDADSDVTIKDIVSGKEPDSSASTLADYFDSAEVSELNERTYTMAWGTEFWLGGRSLDSVAILRDPSAQLHTYVYGSAGLEAALNNQQRQGLFCFREAGVTVGRLVGGIEFTDAEGAASMLAKPDGDGCNG